MTPEGKVAAYLLGKLAMLGWDQRKLSYEGRRGAPDRLILAPGCHVFVELKAPGKEPPDYQLREHDRLRAAGCRVAVVSSAAEVDDLIFKILFNEWSEQ